MPKKITGEGGWPPDESKLVVKEQAKTETIPPEDNYLKDWIVSHDTNRGLNGGMRGPEENYSDYTLLRQIPHLKEIDKMGQKELEAKARQLLDEYLNERIKYLVEDLAVPERSAELFTYFNEVDSRIIELQNRSPRLVALLDFFLPKIGNLSFIDNDLTGSTDWAKYPASQMMRERLGENHEVFLIAKLAELKEKLILLRHREPDLDVLQEARDWFSIAVIKDLGRDWEGHNKKLIAEIMLTISPEVRREYEAQKREDDEEYGWSEHDEATSVPLDEFMGVAKLRENLQKGMDKEFAVRLAEKQGVEAASKLTGSIKQGLGQIFSDAAELGNQIKALPYPVRHIIDIAVGAKDDKLPIAL